MDSKRIKEEMKKWLEARGWPNSVGDADVFIMRNLDGMFQHLLNQGLVKPEYYEQYVMAANIKYAFRNG